MSGGGRPEGVTPSASHRVGCPRPTLVTRALARLPGCGPCQIQSCPWRQRCHRPGGPDRRRPVGSVGRIQGPKVSAARGCGLCGREAPLWTRPGPVAAGDRQRAPQAPEGHGPGAQDGCGRSSPRPRLRHSRWRFPSRVTVFSGPRCSFFTDSTYEFTTTIKDTNATNVGKRLSVTTTSRSTKKFIQVKIHSGEARSVRMCPDVLKTNKHSPRTRYVIFMLGVILIVWYMAVTPL